MKISNIPKCVHVYALLHVLILFMQTGIIKSDRFCSASRRTWEVVQSCPTTETGVKERATKKDCERLAKLQNCTAPSKFKYHCVINAQETVLIEVCAPTYFILGYCAEYNVDGARIQDHYNRRCTAYSPPCPTRYISTDAYHYTGCYEVVRRNRNSIFRIPTKEMNTQSSMNATSKSDTNNPHILLIAVMVFLVLEVVYIAPTATLTKHDTNSSTTNTSGMPMLDNRDFVIGNTLELQGSLSAAGMILLHGFVSLLLKFRPIIFVSIVFLGCVFIVRGCVNFDFVPCDSFLFSVYFFMLNVVWLVTLIHVPDAHLNKNYTFSSTTSTSGMLMLDNRNYTRDRSPTAAGKFHFLKFIGPISIFCTCACIASLYSVFVSRAMIKNYSVPHDESMLTYLMPVVLLLVFLVTILLIKNHTISSTTNTSGMPMLKNRDFVMNNTREGSLIEGRTFNFLHDALSSVSLFLKFIGPITIVPTIVRSCVFIVRGYVKCTSVPWGVSMLVTAVSLILSLYASHRNTQIPLWTRKKGFHILRSPLHQVYSFLIGVLVSWLVCDIMTAIGDFRSDEEWAHIPYPGQFGSFSFSISVFVGFLIGTVISLIYSIGDYYACAKMVNIPRSPLHSVNREIAREGFYSLIAVFMGFGHSATTYRRHIGGIGVTKQTLISLSGVMAFSLLVVVVACATPYEDIKTTLLSSTLLMTGMCTVFKSVIGSRLPLFQGAAGNCLILIPLLAMKVLDKTRCDLPSNSNSENPRDILERIKDIFRWKQHNQQNARFEKSRNMSSFNSVKKLSVPINLQWYI